MKITVARKAEAEFDTAAERARIETCFSKKGEEAEIRKMLLQLVELVEKGEWALAVRLLEAPWWRGRSQDGTPRTEYIGTLFSDWKHIPLYIGGWTYADLAEQMVGAPAEVSTIVTRRRE